MSDEIKAEGRRGMRTASVGIGLSLVSMAIAPFVASYFGAFDRIPEELARWRMFGVMLPFFGLAVAGMMSHTNAERKARLGIDSMR